MSAKTDMVEFVRTVQETTGAVISANSTLMRLKVEALVDMANDLAGDEYLLDFEKFTCKKVKKAKAEKTSDTAEVVVSKGRATYGDDAVITVIVAEFPGREGSASMARRQLFKSGMTVAKYLAKADERGRAALLKAVRRGWITVTEA